jgi:hypothetical protein
MKIQGTLAILFGQKGKITGNHSKVKENIIYGAGRAAIHIPYNDLRDSSAGGQPKNKLHTFLLPLYIVVLRTKMPACVVETS